MYLFEQEWPLLTWLPRPPDGASSQGVEQRAVQLLGVALRPCGPPSISTCELSTIASCERLPLASNGKIASEAPCMTSVGTSILNRSSRKSVRPNAVIQSNVPFGEAKDAMSRW